MGSTPYLSLQLRAFSAEEPESWQPVLDQAVAADRAGIGKVVVADHVAFGSALDDYGNPALGGMAGAKQPTGPDGHWLEPLTVLGVIAGQTTQIRLGTNILLAALRRPAVLAKQLATLDVLSGGRVDLGVGVGWQRAEYEACGLDFDRRGHLLNQTLEVCQALWTDPVAEFAGNDLSFAGIHAMPKPAQQGGVPIWVSGTVNKASMRRLATFGAGWIPWGADAANIEGGISAMREAVTGHGGDPSALQVVGTLPVAKNGDAIDLAATMAEVPRLVNAGVTDFRAHLPTPAGLDEATEFLSGVVAAFTAAL